MASALFTENARAPSKIVLVNSDRDIYPFLKGVDEKFCRDRLLKGSWGSSGQICFVSGDSKLCIKIIDCAQKGLGFLKESKESAEREVELFDRLNQLEIRHIPKLFYIVIGGNKMVIVMENLGEGLGADFMYNIKRRREFDDLKVVATGALVALIDMHKKELGHFHVKPNHITEGGLLGFDSVQSLRVYQTYTSEMKDFFCSPERVLGFSYDGKDDSFCLGLSLFTLYTGEDFFDYPFVGSKEEKRTIYLSLLQQRIGRKLPEHFLKGKCSHCYKVPSGGTAALYLRKTFQESIRLRGRALRHNEEEVELFIALLKQLLELDKNARISCDEALRHSFFKRD